MEDNKNDLGEHIFRVEFETLKKYANKIKNDLYKVEILERIAKYSNDKNELKLSTIIDFTNDITIVKEALFPDEDEDDEVSKTNCIAIIEYLQNFVSHKVFHVKQEDMDDDNSVNQEKTNEVNEENKKENDEPQSPKPQSSLKSTMAKNFDEKLNTTNNSKTLGNDNNLNVANIEEISSYLESSLSNTFKESIEPKLEQLEHTWKKDVQNFIQKSENDKKIIKDWLDNFKETNAIKSQEFFEMLTKKLEFLMTGVDNYSKNNSELLVSSIKSEMEIAIKENKIQTTLSEKHVKSLNGVKIAVLFSFVTVLCSFIMLSVGMKWYSNSVKYENIQKVQSSLAPYEQNLFQQIITKGYANTKDNPRNSN